MNQETRNPGRELGNSAITDRVIAAALRVHKDLGPGFLESVYEQALAIEFTANGIAFERQKTVPIYYRGTQVGEHRMDFLVEDSVVVELKAIASIEPIHFAIGRSYLKASGLEDGLLLNFASVKLVIKRFGREYAPSSRPDFLA